MAKADNSSNEYKFVWVVTWLNTLIESRTGIWMETECSTKESALELASEFKQAQIRQEKRPLRG